MHECMILGISYFTPPRQCRLCNAYCSAPTYCSPLLHHCPIAYKTTHHPQEQLLALPFMSHPHTTASSNFQFIINNALDNYKRRTKNDLISHPLTAQLQSCDSPSDILAVLHQQLYELDQSRSTDERWSRWLDPTVNVIYVLSSTLAAGVSLVCLTTWTCLGFTHSCSSVRCSRLQMSYFPGSGFSFRCVYYFLPSFGPL